MKRLIKKDGLYLCTEWWSQDGCDEVVVDLKNAGYEAEYKELDDSYMLYYPNIKEADEIVASAFGIDTMEEFCPYGVGWLYNTVIEGETI
tara:strand:+ start:277 stop:546 length:270 start_codon:yes stop_codon:yes gene_type:complete